MLGTSQTSPQNRATPTTSSQPSHRHRATPTTTEITSTTIVEPCDVGNTSSYAECLRPGHDLSYTDYSGADLSNANLSGANLTGANLSGANLSGANLTGVGFLQVCGAIRADEIEAKASGDHQGERGRGVPGACLRKKESTNGDHPIRKLGSMSHERWAGFPPWADWLSHLWPDSPLSHITVAGREGLPPKNDENEAPRITKKHRLNFY